MVARATKEFEVHPYVQFMDDHYAAYRSWLKSEGLPVVSGSFVHDVRTMELGDWQRRGGRGAYLSFSDQMASDMYVCEIPPGQSLLPQRQLIEELVLVASGHGTTSIWHEGSPKHTFEWGRGSLFAVPLNSWHQHFNAAGGEPARFVALTNAPVVFELFRDPEFIFNSDYRFTDRFASQEKDFFRRPDQYLTEYYGGILRTNLVSDVRKIELVPRERRGIGNRNMYIHIAGSSTFAHISRFPVGTYKKAHRHGPGAHVCMVDSTGYTLMWDEGETPQRYDWAEGSVISPPAGTWHQHFNTGTEPCRFVALHASVAVQREEKGVEQIEFEDEDPEIRRMYVEECEKHGVTPRLPDSP